MRKNTLILTGGSICPKLVEDLLDAKKIDCVIGVDGGCRFAIDHGIFMDYAVGDFDTLEADYFEMIPKETEMIKLNPQKDETDTETAILLARDIKSSGVFILGGIGSRVDHSMANIALLQLLLKAKIPGWILDEHNKICLVDQSYELARTEKFGTYISLLPFTEEVRGICLKGMKYSLEDGSMSRFYNPSLGVSNEIVGEKGVITLKSGILVVIESKD